MPESTRRQIGKYQIQAELGRGGFGVVYSAYDPTVGRPVAVKVLTAIGDNQLLTRFKNEAAAAGNLRHKNIVTIYDYGDDDGLPYIVMELLEGEDLNQIIAARRPMPLLQKVSIMVQVADGLHSAHRAGVVHRDVKPGNMRLLPDGTVKLMDFGIARLVADSAATRLTRQGHVIGTLYYMAPEQVLGEEADALSDIFAYGSTYYELLTGKHPFQGLDPRSVFHKITAEDPEPIRSLVPDCPEALEKIVNRTLQKDRDLRYPSLRDVQVDTEPILIELRQERAEALVAEAKRLYGTAELQSAQTVLGEVFDLDPANREARQLRETIQTQLLHRLIRPKLEALVKKAEAALSTRRFEDAIESLEAALRLDRDNHTVSQKLEQARECLTLRREMAVLIADARRLFSKQTLEAALEVLLQVIERDPSNPEAQQLLDEARIALRSREKERQYQEKLQQARELLQANSFDKSARLLEELDAEFKNGEEVGELAAQIRSRKELIERQEQLKEEISAIRELLAGAKFELAIKRVEAVMNRFPEEVEPTRLFILAHKQLAAHRKDQALSKLENELNLLTASGHFERALSLISRSLNTYSSEPRLLEAQRRINEQWAHQKREAAIRQLLDDSERFATHSEFEKAVQVLETAFQQYPEDPRIVGSLAAKRREEGIVKLLSQAQAQLNRREYQHTLDLIDRGLSEYGSDERLTGTRAKIVTAKAEWERAEEIRGLVDKSGQLVAQNHFEAALELLDSGLRRFPDESELAEALASTHEALKAKLREEGITTLCNHAQAQMDERQFQLAFESIDRGLAEYGRDRRLSGFRDRIALAKAEWERAEAVRQIAENAQNSLAQQDFSKAISLLESSLKRYRGESLLVEGLRSARNAFELKRRDDAIRMLCGQVQTQVDKHDFANALKTVNRGLQDYGSDSRLTGMRDTVLSAKADWERAESIRRAVEIARQCVERGQPERALETLEPILEQYPDEPKLMEGRAVAREALASKQREQAIEALGRQTQAQLEAGAYQDAIELLDRGLHEYGADRRLTDVRKTAVSAKAAWQRAQAIARIVEDSRNLVTQEEFEKAIALLESALNEYPGEAQIAQPIQAARKALAAKRQAESIQALCGEAQLQCEKRDFARALKIIDQGEKDYGSDRVLSETRKKIFDAKAGWERAEAVRQVVAEAQNLVAQRDFHKAISLLESSLKRHPGEAPLTQALVSARNALEANRRDDAIESLCGQAQTLIDNRDFVRALKNVDQGERDYGSDTRLSAMRDRALRSKADWERADTVRNAVENANTHLAQQNPAFALELLEAALKHHPDDPQLTEALNVARKALDAVRREQAIEKLLGQAQRNLQAREFELALDALDRGLKDYGADRRLSDLHGKVLSAKSDSERAEALLQLVTEARQQITTGQPESALELLNSARSRFGHDPQLDEAIATAREAIEAKRREQAIQTACESAKVQLDEREYGPALEILDAAPKAEGNDPRLTAMRDNVVKAKGAWERSQAIRSVLEESGNRISENDAEGAIDLLNRELAMYPGEPELLKALAEAQEALQAAQKAMAIEALTQETRVFIGAQDFPTALVLVEQGLKAYGPESRLADLRETILVAQADWERMDGLRQALEEANDHIAQGAPEKAIRLLEKALALFPGESVLLDALASARDAVELKGREESIERICTEARRQLDLGKFDAALQQVAKGLKENPTEARLLELHKDISLANAEAQRLADEIKSVLQSAKNLSEQGQREEAIALLERALNEHPANPELVAAIVETIDAVGAAGTIALDKICRSARQHMLTGDFDLAFHNIEQALRLQGDEQQVDIGLKTRSEAAKIAGAGSSFHSEAGALASVKEATDEQVLPGAISEAPAEIPATHKYEEEATPDLLPGFAGEVSGPKAHTFKRWWLIACTAALLVVSIVVIWIARTPTLAVLQVQTSPRGAIVSVNGQKCSTAACEFRLKPGQYRIETSADGYQERIETATLRYGGAQPPMIITLEPLSPTVRVSANFREGDVVLDNGKADRMQDGQLVVDRLSPGQHNLRISGREGSASISFDAQYAKLPAFTNISQQNTDVIASGIFGNRAVVACSGCSGAVSMDERQIGELKDGAITIDNVGPGTHRVRIGEGRSLVFSTGKAPGINFVVNSNRNFGALVIEANVNNVNIFIDGKKYSRPTSRGQLSIPEEAKQHTIRVAKEGYRVEPPEIRAQLKKGDQFQARFHLIQEPARLLVSRQLPGAAVWIDGSIAGAVKPDGSFSAQLPPGGHRIEFRKEGYTSAMVQRSFEPGGQIILSRAEAPLVANAVAPPIPVIPAPPKPDPNAVEQADWQRAQGTLSVAQVQEFLKNHPAGIHRDEAQARLKELRLQQAEAAREAAWNATDKKNRAALQQFLTQYGEGLHAQDARTMIAAIDKQQQDQLAAAEQAKEQANRKAADSAAILSALKDFERAYNQKSLALLQGLWTGMPKSVAESYRNQFRDAKSLDFRLTPAGHPAVSGNEATVICTRSLRFVAKNGQRPPETNDRVRIGLERSGSQWTIRSMTLF
jgi:tetratricopeptide (TPR) repeat protein